MEWKDLSAKIADAAPILGSLFGPVGTGIGTGIKLLASAFGLKESEVTPEKVDELLKTDPQAILKLRLAEMDYKVKMREQDIEELRVQWSPHIEETKAKTVPWVDGLHKLGRQILNLFNIVATVWLMLDGKTITPEVVLLLGGPNVAYQLIKGRGQANGKT